MVNASILANNSNITTFDQMVTVASQITDYWFSTLTIIAVFLIMYLGLGFYKNTSGLVASSFVAFVLSVLFLSMNAITALAPAITGIMVVASGLYLYKQSPSP